MLRKYLFIIIGLLGLFTSKVYSQATTTLSIDSISILSPVIMGGITNFGVQVRVNNLFAGDTITGDIFYYYLTDSMISAGIPPRIFEQDTSEFVSDPFWDTVHVDIQPNEIRTGATGPLNLIVIWPAMIHPAIADTDSVTFYITVEGFLGLETAYPPNNEHIIYPSPAQHYLFIKPDDMNLIAEIQLLNLQGQMVDRMHQDVISSGWINIDGLKTGAYMAVIYYKNGNVVYKKFLKE
jgi:hypothetical protein